MTLYLDYAATTPAHEAVADEVRHFMLVEYGNAGSRTHDYGARAKQRVERARQEVAALVDADPSDVIFTSGATESNNLAILGMAQIATTEDRKHIISTAIEHKAVLEPLEELARRGFSVELVSPTKSGAVDVADVVSRVRPDTALVSVMQVNNETGVIQPVNEIAQSIPDPAVLIHCDAAQGIAKTSPSLDPRIDLVSISAHKLGGPKGIGALITRRRSGRRPQLTPLMYGGGQERGLRPGTLPVAAIAGFGTAAMIAARDFEANQDAAQRLHDAALSAFGALDAVPNGERERAVPNILNLSIPGVDSEAALVALKGVAAISNGSACTSQSYSRSHVLAAMGLPSARIDGALRLSWGAGTRVPDWSPIVERLRAIATPVATTPRVG